jgi:type I restriction enzyme S subunit
MKAKFKETEIGRIPGEWEVKELKDISDDVSYGYTASANEERVGPKFLRITDIVPPVIDWDSVPYCEIENGTIEKYALREGDIVIARTGANTGANAVIRGQHDAVFASYLIRFRINRGKANPYYVAYILKSDSWNNYTAQGLKL